MGVWKGEDTGTSLLPKEPGYPLTKPVEEIGLPTWGSVSARGSVELESLGHAMPGFFPVTIPVREWGTS